MLKYSCLLLLILIPTASVQAAEMLHITETPTSHGTIPPGSQRVPFLSLKLEAPCGGDDVELQSLTFRHGGAGALQDFAALYLLSEAGERLSSPRAFSDRSGKITLPLSDWTLPACATQTLVLAADISASASPAAVHRLQFTGMEPARSFQHTMAKALAAEPIRVPAGRLKYEFLTVTKRPRATVLGTLHRFQLENDTQDAQELRSIHFTLGGTIRESDLTGLQLRRHNQVLAKAAKVTKTGVTFTLSQPFALPRSSSIQFSVMGIVQRRAYGTLSFSIRDASDIVVQTRRERTR